MSKFTLTALNVVERPEKGLIEALSLEIYEPTKTLTFVLTPTETLVSTPLQTFIVRYDHDNYRKQRERLREQIREGNMKSITDVIDYCKFKSGNYHDQMCGLELVPTRLDRYL